MDLWTHALCTYIPLFLYSVPTLSDEFPKLTPHELHSSVQNARESPPASVGGGHAAPAPRRPPPLRRRADRRGDPRAGRAGESRASHAGVGGGRVAPHG